MARGPRPDNGPEEETMLPSIFNARVLILLAVACALVAPASAQERGENINGFVTLVDGRSVVVKNDDGREINIRVTSSTEVYFQDSGDRKLFPNPTIDDLRAGMGVHFNFSDGAPSRIVVHYVPAGYVRSSPPAAPAARAEQVRVRIQSIDRAGREMRADVAGRSRTFTLEDRSHARGFRVGDLVVVTLEDKGRGQVVTNIASAELSGTVRRVDTRQRAVVIYVDGRDETYDVDNDKLLEAVSKGDRVRFVVEERGGRRVVTEMQRRD
jgi:Cu/Ag efflux protein CusF